MTDAESECWASAQRWHEKYLKAEAGNERLRAALDRAADALEFYDNKAEAQKARAALRDTKP